MILLRRSLRELRQALLELCLPPQCPGCGCLAPGPCQRCQQLLLCRPPPYCQRCGTPVLSPSAPCQVDHDRLRNLQLARSPFLYHGAAGDMVRRAKFQHDRTALHYLARSMAARSLPHGKST